MFLIVFNNSKPIKKQTWFSMVFHLEQNILTYLLKNKQTISIAIFHQFKINIIIFLMYQKQQQQNVFLEIY